MIFMSHCLVTGKIAPLPLTLCPRLPWFSFSQTKKTEKTNKKRRSREKRQMPPKSEVKNEHHLRKGDQTAFETARRLISARCLSASHASVLRDKLIKHHGNAASPGAICSCAGRDEAGPLRPPRLVSNKSSSGVLRPR